MRALLHTEFDALLARPSVSQASFARLTGVTARQLNNWARGSALVPRWAVLLAVTLQDVSPESLTISLEEAEFSCRDILGIPPNADTVAARRAMTRLGAPLPSGQGRPARADDPPASTPHTRRRSAICQLEKVTDPLRTPKGQTEARKEDRQLARSVSHLLAVIEQLEASGAHFRSLHDPIDTSTPQGMFSLQVLGAVAQLERALIAERTKAGLNAARSRGRIGGNPLGCAPVTRTRSGSWSGPDVPPPRIWMAFSPIWIPGCPQFSACGRTSPGAMSYGS